MKRAWKVLAGLLVLPVAAAIAFGLAHVHAVRTRDQRLSELKPQLPALRALPQLTGAQACDLVEFELLSQRINRGLEVDCEAGSLEMTNPRVLKVKVKRRTQVLGGAFGEHYCVAKFPTGWSAVKNENGYLEESFYLHQCNIEVGTASAEALVTNVKASGADAQRTTALTTLAAVRESLKTDNANGSGNCDALPDLAPPVFDVISSEILEGRQPDERIYRLDAHWAASCSLPDGGPLGSMIPCGLRTPWTHALVLADSVVDTPVMIRADEYRGGSFSTTLKLVDLSAGRVLCSKPIECHLKQTEVFGKVASLRTRFEERVMECVCTGLRDLSHGRAHLDPGQCPN